MIAIRSEGKRAAQIDVLNSMRRDTRQEIWLVERGTGIDLILQVLSCVLHSE